MSIEIAPLDAEHIAACAAIMAETALWRDTYGVTAERAAQALQAASDDTDQTLCVALDPAAVVVGFACYARRGAFHHGSYLRLLAVHPAYRGQRLGEQLVQHVEANVLDETPHLFLLATAHNQGAQRFYQRLGYQHVGALPDFVIPGITEYIFWKCLA